MVPITIYELAHYCNFVVQSEFESNWQFCAPEGQKQKGHEFSLGTKLNPKFVRNYPYVNIIPLL